MCKSTILRSKKPKASHRSGAIIVLFAILLPLMILILGFTVDYAFMQRSRNETRVIADLAAKAAIDTLARTGGDEAAAMAAARFIASNNTVAGNPVELRDDQIIFGRSYEQADASYTYVAGDRPANAVQVLARRDNTSVGGPISTFFGAPYGRPTFNVAELAEATFRDVEIVLVLDRSASMKYPVSEDISKSERKQRTDELPRPDSRWVVVDRAIKVFLAQLELTAVQEKVGLVTFAKDSSRSINGRTLTVEAATLDSQLSSNLGQVRSNMDRLNTSIWFGGTNITAGLRQARQHFASSGSGNVEKLIICLTDGVQNANGEEEPHVEAARCLEAGIKVHTITFSDGADETSMSLAAENGGGTHNHAPDEESLKIIFERLAGSVSFLSK